MAADRLEIEGTDLEVVAYVNAGGNLVIRVNKSGVCIADVGIQHATDDIPQDELMQRGALMKPVLRDLRRATIQGLMEEFAGKE
jgi:hypothetical protein